MEAAIVIFEDNATLRDTLVMLLKTTPGYLVIGDYGDCKKAREIVRELKPEIVIMDIDMPEVDGIAGVQQIKEARPETAVIMYTVFEDDDKLFKCLCAGANGYLLKKTPPEKLIDSLDEVLQGGSPMSPLIATKVLSSFRKSEFVQYNLSLREKEVLQLLTQGFSGKRIAEQLFISFDTVRSHLKNIYTKLHVNCGKEAIAKALKERIV